MARLPDPLSRRDLQKLTRERLIFAARMVFARDGFHGARLDVIAKEAGFSKGAVYSNFDSKADLFLAVMDANIAALGDASEEGDLSSEEVLANPEFEEAVRGFGLATLEFIATAARDDRLIQECGRRIALLVEGYREMAVGMGVDRGKAVSLELGALIAALDQGAAMLSLAGHDAINDRLLNLGIKALLELGNDPDMRPDDPDDSAFHHQEVRRRIALSMGAAYLAHGQQ